MKSLIVAAGLLAAAAFGQEFTQGTLRRVDPQRRALAECPLKHTTVRAAISGMLARVNVVQEFHNPLAETIEAV